VTVSLGLSIGGNKVLEEEIRALVKDQGGVSRSSLKWPAPAKSDAISVIVTSLAGSFHHDCNYGCDAKGDGFCL